MPDEKAQKQTKSRKKAQDKVPEHIVFPDNYWIFAADLSLKRPGFCRIHVHKTEGSTVEFTKVNCMSVDNKTDTKKTHGQLLDEIFYAMGDFKPHLREGEGVVDKIFYVREHAFNARGSMKEMGIFEVVGVTNFWAYQHGESQWHEIYPVQIKKLITGNGKASKEEVAEGLKKYLPDLQFKNDDESDATAVAIAWLIQHGELKQIESEEQNEESNNDKGNTP